METYIHTKTCTQILRVDLFVTAKTMSKFGVFHLPNGKTNSGLPYYSFLNNKSELLIYPTIWEIIKWMMLVKEANSKGYMVHDSIYRTFWKKHNYRSMAARG